MRLLVVEDDATIRGFITRSLSEAGYVVDAVPSAAQADKMVLQQDYAAIVLDLGLPDTDGFDLMSRWRNQGVAAPMLILSARRSIDDRVRGLEEGGDDYMTKPFAIAELNARLRNLIKRNSNVSPSSPTCLRALDLEMNLLSRQANRDGRNLTLTSQEFLLLEYLCRNAGRVVTRSMILEQVWKMRSVLDTNIIDVHIYRLRSKVDAPGERPLIKTLRGVGYVLQNR